MTVDPLIRYVLNSPITILQTQLRLAHKYPTVDYYKSLHLSLKSISDPLITVFDEAYYLIMNNDVSERMFTQGDIASGLHHFLSWGIYEDRLPLRSFDLIRMSRIMLGDHVDDQQFFSFDKLCDCLPFMPPEVLAKCYIREPVILSPTPPRLRNRNPPKYADRPWLDAVKREFDMAYYSAVSRKTFQSKDAAFLHYLVTNTRVPVNPRSDFDEAFYRNFYYDIGDAIRRGELLCGFEHYVAAGRDEKRLAVFDSTATLERLIPNVTSPVGLERLSETERKVYPCAHNVNPGKPPTVWIILPFLNSDIMFGGFTAILEFIESLIRRSVRIGIFFREAPQSSISYYKYRSPNRPLSKAIDQMAKYSPIDCAGPFEFGYDDLFVCYSTWDSLWGIQFARKTRFGKAIFWIQEFEAIFHPFDSLRAIMNSVYEYSHIGIFNSEFLRQYFHRNRIGLYREPLFLGNYSMSYEHVLQYMPPARQKAHSRGKIRRLLVYTRPEAHAARNLFEFAIIGLRQAILRGVFRGDWEFVGVGSLGGPYSVPLDSERNLEIVQKMPLEQYTEFIQDIDIGISLMYAPHPSLLPYELALTGAVVITNNFETRGPAYYSRYEGNIESFDLTIDGYVEAIGRAVTRISADGYKKHVPAHTSNTWEDVFSDEFFDTLRNMGVSFDIASSKSGRQVEFRSS